MIKEVEKIIIDILAHELELPPIYGKDARGNEIPVFTIGYANAMLGSTDKLQISVQTMNQQPIANNSKLDTSVTPPLERQYYSALQTIQIDVMSGNTDARTRVSEVILALDSIYAVQQEEKFQFKLSTMNSTFNNVSELEGEKNINRFVLTITAFCWYYKTKKIVDYYDKFSIRADDEKTISEVDGLVELNYDFSGE